MIENAAPYNKVLKMEEEILPSDVFFLLMSFLETPVHVVLLFYQ